MKKINKEIEVYKYDELNDRAKDKANRLVYDILNESITNENIKEEVNYQCNSLFGFEPDSISYDIGFYNGDYFNFNLKYVFMNHKNSIFWKEIKKELTRNELDKLDYFLQKDYDFDIIYNYKYTPTIEVNDTYFYNYEDEYDLLGEELHNKIVKVLEDACDDICGKLQNVIYGMLDFSEEHIIQIIEDWNLEFTENGDIFDE